MVTNRSRWIDHAPVGTLRLVSQRPTRRHRFPHLKGDADMLTVGDRIPPFDLQSVVSIEQDKAFTRINDKTDAGKWKVIFFWPKDFTFVCPTEIAAFGKLNREFNDRDAVVYGASTDSEFVHLAWRKSHADLKDLPFPMLADIKRELSARSEERRVGKEW